MSESLGSRRSSTLVLAGPPYVATTTNMPARGGLSAYDHLSQSTTTVATPVIFISAYPSEQAQKRVLEIGAALKLLSRMGRVHEVGSLFTAIPQLYLEKSEIRCPEQLKEDVMAEIRKKVSVFGASDINIADGLRLEYDDAWMLLRPSDASPAITVMAESPSRSRTVGLLARGAGAVHSALARFEL